jgi:hypothetical protein
MPVLEDTLSRLEAADFTLLLLELGRMDRWSGDDIAELDAPEYLRSDPGHPLGVGMPTGRTLREDGESHLDAWAAIVRLDPCSYCGRDGGTLDHIDPAASPAQRYVWVNFTAACEGCNRSKKDTPLLEWLAHRRVLVRG